MSGSLQGRVIIVTGAGAGIGRTTSLLLAAAGATIIVAEREEASGEETAALVAKAGGTALFIRTDVAQEADIVAMVDQTIARFGKLDGAFNNAGVSGCFKPLHETTTEDWRRVLEVDLTGVFWCMKYEIAAMLKTGGGSIVNTSSTLGVVAQPNFSDYVAAKHGVIGLTKAAALDYATRGIRVNAVLPGLTMTPIVSEALKDETFAKSFDSILALHPIGRAAVPDEIGHAVRWLLSDEASFVTGVSLPVDGGNTAA